METHDDLHLFDGFDFEKDLDSNGWLMDGPRNHVSDNSIDYFSLETLPSTLECPVFEEETKTPESSASISPELKTKFLEGGIKLHEIKFSKCTIQKCENIRKYIFEPRPIADPRNKPKFNKNAKCILDTWFEDHIQQPYLEKHDVMLLKKQTGLDDKQIRTYFVNKRIRSSPRLKRQWRTKIDI